MTRKFLIIRFSSIGDLFLTTPIARALHEKFPEAEIHYLTKKKFKFVIEDYPYIHKIISFDKRLSHALQQVNKEKYTDIIDLHNNLRSNYILSRVKAQKGRLRKYNIAKWLYVKFKWQVLPTTHIIDRYFEAAKMWGIVPDGKGPDVFIPPHDEVEIPQDWNKGFIAAVIGGTHFTKRMPMENWLTLLKDLQLPVVLLGGKEEEKAGSYLQHKLPGKVYNYCGKLRLFQSVSFLRQSEYVITHDTGLMHIAAALNKPMTVIWGSTDPKLGLGPYLQNGLYKYDASVVRGLRCHPCSKIGFSACPKKHFHCMKHQQVKEISKRVNLLMQ